MPFLVAGSLRMALYRAYLGYTFRKVGQSDTQIRVAAGVQNVFVLTKYSGLDPESSVAGGIDGNIYPRPRVFSVRLGINF